MAALNNEHSEYFPIRLTENFVDEQVSQRGYGISSEYVRELIRNVLVAGVASAPAGRADGEHFDALRARVPKRRG